MQARRWRRFSYLLSEVGDVLRNLAPDRRRARYGDLDFDWDYRVDTTASNVGFRTQLRGVFAGSQYQPADPALFSQDMNALSIDFSRYIFIDAGCGKGRALLMACQYGFRRVMGIEVVPELHAAAKRNTEKWSASVGNSCPVEVWLGDARQFSWPPEPTVLFLFNPFPEWVLRSFLERLRGSLEKNPRIIWIVYHNPVLASVVRSCGFVEKGRGTIQSALYTNELYEPA